jgi:hypothetical protein
MYIQQNPRPGASPTIGSYNAAAEKFYNANSSLDAF